MSGAGTATVAAVLLTLLAAVTGRTAANFPPPEWAYPQTPRPFTSDPDDGRPKHLAGSTRAYRAAHAPGPTTELMKPIAGQLTLQEMIDVAASIGSNAP